MVPTFSIITICFNEAEVLVPTIRSVVAQRQSSFQYVIQDRGSSDDTALLVRGYGDWIDIFHSEQDSGAYQAMNRAVQHCTGTYTLFVNAADVLASATVLSDIEGLLQADDDVVTGNSLDLQTGNLRQFLPPDKFWAGMTFDHQAAIVRTELLRQDPFDESLRMAGVFDFFSRVRKKGANFRAVEQTICRKADMDGDAARFVQLFRERFGIAMRNFGDDHPVEQALKGELAQHMLTHFRGTYLTTRLEGMSVDEMLVLHDELESAAPNERRWA